MAYSEGKYEKIKEVVSCEMYARDHFQDIKQTGTKLQMNCPFGGTAHTDLNSKSFGIDIPQDGFNCLVCGIKGYQVIDLCIEHKGLHRTFGVEEAYNYLHQKYFIENRKNIEKVILKPKEKNIPAEKTPNKIYNVKIDIKDDVPHLQNKYNLKKSTLEYFEVGEAKHGKLVKGCIVIPVHNKQGQKIGYASKNYQTDNKYATFFDKSLELFNQHRAKAFIKKYDKNHIIVVEGYFQAMYLVQEGFCNVVATMGIFPSKAQIRDILELSTNIVLFYDGDVAGKESIDNFIDKFQDKAKIRVVNYPTESKDFKPQNYTKPHLKEFIKNSTTRTGKISC